MNLTVYKRQDIICKMFEADSVAIQLVKGSVYYTIIDGPFSICIESKNGKALFTIYYNDKELYSEKKKGLIVALKRSKKLLQDFKERAYRNLVQKEINEERSDQTSVPGLEVAN